MKNVDFMEKLAVMPQLGYLLIKDFKIDDLNTQLNNTEIKTLFFIKHEECTSMKELSNLNGIEKSSFSSVAEKLIKKGLVERAHSQIDKRKVELALTKEGRKTIEAIEKKLSTYVDDKLSILEEEEKEVLLDALEKIEGIVTKFKVSINGRKCE